MPGILPHGAAAFLTRLSGDLIDFGNFGRTITTRGLRGYDLEHLKKVSFIWGSTILGGILSYFTATSKDNKDSTNCCLITLGVLAGFLVSHTLTINYRIQARKELNQQLDEANSSAINLIRLYLKNPGSAQLSQQLWDNLAAINKAILAPQSRTTLTLSLQEKLKRTNYFKEILLKDINNGTEIAAAIDFWDRFESENRKTNLLTLK